MSYLRSALLQTIRFLGLSHRVDNLRYRWNKLRMHSRNKAFKAANPDFILPPDYLMYESYRIDYTGYRNSGLTAAHWLREHLEPYVDNLEGLHILDWGCGPARILRQLPQAFGESCTYYGVDPNAKSVAWCQTNLPGFDVRLSKLNPPLPHPAKQFDFLYGISIFTHLSGPAHSAWLAELMRVLKPGGIALLTTHGPAYRVKLIPSEKIAYDQADDWVIRGKVAEGHRVFTAYHPPALFRALAEAHGEVINYVPGQPKDWGIEQDIWVIRKS